MNEDRVIRIRQLMLENEQKRAELWEQLDRTFALDHALITELWSILYRNGDRDFDVTDRVVLKSDMVHCADCGVVLPAGTVANIGFIDSLLEVALELENSIICGGNDTYYVFDVPFEILTKAE